jgi:membrane-bound lytic murein transglycosylase MltF
MCATPFERRTDSRESFVQLKRPISGGKWRGSAFAAVAVFVVPILSYFSAVSMGSEATHGRSGVPTISKNQRDSTLETRNKSTTKLEKEPVVLSDEQAFLELATKAWTGDLDAMLKRGFIRILTTYNPLFFFYDGAEQRGILHDGMRAFAERLQKAQRRGQPPVRILFIPVARDELLPALVEGRGDIVVANLTVTPARQKIVQFTDPSYPNVSELVVTGPAAPPVTSLDDLTSLSVHIRESSSYFEHLLVLNEERKRAGLKPIRTKKVDERLEDYDLLEMVSAGLIPAVIVDSHTAAFWAQVFDKIKVHDDLATNRGGNIAWAIRKNSPKLLKAANAFLKKARKGTRFGNILIKRYLGNTEWIDNALTGAGWKRYQAVIGQIKKYAKKYDFDWLIIIAQGYQESKLDQSKVSPAGAVGIMQVLPRTAADPNVGITGIEQPEENVHAGVKYLRFLRERYFTDPMIDPVDQMLFSFAAYNAGPGKIKKARNRAARMKLDPNRWFGHVEVAAARTIGREPVNYVRNIYKYYVTYKLFEDERAEREAARRSKDYDKAR